MKDFKEFYNKTRKELQKELKLKNIFQVPHVDKILIHVGIGSIIQKTKDYNYIIEHLSALSGQKPKVIKAKKSVSNFKLREGMDNSLLVTLRGDRKLDMLYKLISVVFPRVRDFRGLSKKSFDKNGNYSIGLKEVNVFPEVNPQDINQIHGVQVSLSISNEDKEHSYIFLKKLGFPFKD